MQQDTTWLDGFARSTREGGGPQVKPQTVSPFPKGGFLKAKVYNEFFSNAWNTIRYSPFADIVVALFGGVAGGILGSVAGFSLAQVFLAFWVLGLLVGFDPSFNGLTWAIYIGLSTIWVCTAIGCWYFLRVKYDGAILTAILSAVLVAIIFYALSFSLDFGKLALAFPVARVIVKGVLGLRARGNSHLAP